MAKGQKKSGREPKKPKSAKKPVTAATSPFAPPPRDNPPRGGKSGA